MSCPGWYCGRILLENNKLSECGPCPRGYRRNDTGFICEQCLDSPQFYDWLYLGFVVLMVLILHWFFIDMIAMGRKFFNITSHVIALHTSASIEVFLACIISILLIEPMGSFKIYSCKIKSLSDWYTLFHNPAPNYEDKIYCTQEAVYPLYTIVFLFYISSLILMLLIRPWVCSKYFPGRGKISIYAAMYFIPILIFTHAIMGGLIYYLFPYLIVVASVISCAVHFATKLEQKMFALIRITFTQRRNIIILLGHWCLHAYGIISITQLTQPVVHGLLMLLVPLPALFYVFTAKFTDPSKFYS
ncbi:JNK1/MAPK8-associated membrane protein [Rhynchophorus ferrugineus]|uniref:JNK1/MAPK8-associated membrane protein n=1 Tax=Rhynchophorus ferrugineus TaxID=354439 RepID=A0A834IG28_RHYFE|nr:hypothetical protein GWI33_006474 [Rhynchophorus ferrugineus]